MTVQTHLDQTASKAVLSSSEKGSIDTSISTLNSRLRLYFGNQVSDMFRFGSSTRGTILPRSIDARSDIDYMIVFAGSSLRPQTYIDRLKDFAQTKYAQSEISQSHPTVKLSLNHIQFDLVPAIALTYSGYKIPAPKSDYLDWMDTDPNGFNDTIKDANKLSKSLIKPMIRIMKYWNASNGYVFDSFSLERHLVSVSGWRESLRDYVYAAFEGVSVDWNAAQWRTDKIQRAKDLVGRVRQYERGSQLVSAEDEIKKLIPPIV